MAETAVGIDLGTSNSCVAARRGDSVDVLRNSYGESTTASVVFFGKDGDVQVGNAARASIIHDPMRTVVSAKRLIGRHYVSEEVKKAKAICSYEIVDGENNGVLIQIDNEKFTMPEVSAMVLREMKSVAESQLGQQVTKAVITVPAFFNDNQRQATKDAGKIAGLEVLRILNEPTAAALAYGFGQELSQRVAVYDLGGGTFDISVLEISEDVFEVLATCGDTFLGGDDFDDRLIDLIADEFVQSHGMNLRNDRYALEKLKVAAEGAKKGLSLDTEVEIRIPDVIVDKEGNSQSIVRRLDISEYASLVNDLIKRTFKVCDEALQQAGVVARDLDGVILVGGPTRLPLVAEAVNEYFQQPPKSGVDPDEAVAIGAAIHAASLVDPEHEAYLLDVTPLSLRIGVAGGLAEAVIERNTPVPIEQSRAFTTFKDFQESVDIRIYQGESRQTQGNELLGQFVFSGFEKAPRGAVSIDVTFEINADGIVDVRARDRDSGQEASTRITLSTGLSEGDIDKIIEDGRTDRVTTSPSPGSVVAEPRGSGSSESARGGANPVAELQAAPIGVVAAPAPPTRESDGRAIELDTSGDLEIPGLVHAPPSVGSLPAPTDAAASAPEGPDEELLPEPDDLELLDVLEDGEFDLSLEITDVDYDDEPKTDPMLDVADVGGLDDDLFEPVGTELTPSDDPEAGS
jgi:molecular chaperone DnaK